MVLKRLKRLLGRLPGGSPVGLCEKRSTGGKPRSQLATLRRLRRRIEREDPWHSNEIELYRSLMLDRMRDHKCPGCERVLEEASLVKVGGGTALEEYGLSDRAIVRLLACTQRLTVDCAWCGTRTTI